MYVILYRRRLTIGLIRDEKEQSAMTFETFDLANRYIERFQLIAANCQIIKLRWS